MRQAYPSPILAAASASPLVTWAARKPCTSRPSLLLSHLRSKGSRPQASLPVGHASGQTRTPGEQRTSTLRTVCRQEVVPASAWEGLSIPLTHSTHKASPGASPVGGGHSGLECPADPTTGCHCCVPHVAGEPYHAGPGDRPGGAVTAGRTGMCPRPAVPAGRKGMENQPFPPPEGARGQPRQLAGGTRHLPRGFGQGSMGKCAKTKSSVFGGVEDGAKGEKNNLLRRSKHENKWKMISLVFHT